MKITHKEIDITTGIETITEIEETEQDKEIRLHFEAEKVTELKNLSDLEAKRNALFDKLGITEDEANLLLG